MVDCEGGGRSAEGIGEWVGTPLHRSKGGREGGLDLREELLALGLLVLVDEVEDEVEDIGELVVLRHAAVGCACERVVGGNW